MIVAGYNNNLSQLILGINISQGIAKRSYCLYEISL
jgi:hypothetical protein